MKQQIASLRMKMRGDFDMSQELKFVPQACLGRISQNIVEGCGDVHFQRTQINPNAECICSGLSSNSTPYEDFLGNPILNTCLKNRLPLQVLFSFDGCKYSVREMVSHSQTEDRRNALGAVLRYPGACGIKDMGSYPEAVSYTHLTLPTKRIV